jgi:Protein of unknown function (DUF3313)
MRHSLYKVSTEDTCKTHCKPAMFLGRLALATTCVVTLTACTTIPQQDGFLSKADNLQPARGVRGKRLQTPPPVTQISAGAKLFIEPALYTSTASISPTITEPERALILNALMRSICADTSSRFEIVEEAATPDAYRLRIGVSRLVATGKVGASIGTVTGFLMPVGSLRPPIGLGGLTVEFELLEPAGPQAGAMVWSRSADVVSSSSASRIGDAYGFTAAASQDFSNLISSSSTTRRAMGNIRLPFGSRSDAVCAKYGAEAGRLAGAFSAFAIPLPPEWTDRGEVKKSNGADSPPPPYTKSEER